MTNTQPTRFPLDTMMTKLVRHMRANPNLRDMASSSSVDIIEASVHIGDGYGLDGLMAWAMSLDNVRWSASLHGAIPAWYVSARSNVWHAPVRVWVALPESTGANEAEVCRIMADELRVRQQMVAVRATPTTSDTATSRAVAGSAVA